MQAIYLAPVKFSNSSLIKDIREKLKLLLHTEVEIINLHLDTESAFSAERNQYFSTKLIAKAINHSDHIDGKVLIMVEFDLYVPVFTFVYGEAQLNGKHSIVSVCRLHEEFYTGRTDNILLLQRSMKEVLHELGHSYGLFHCKDWDCVMHVSSIIEEVDIKGDFYCHECYSKILVNQNYYKENI